MFRPGAQVVKLFRERHPTPAAAPVNFGSDTTLPSEVREELLRWGLARLQPAISRRRAFPQWWKSVRTFARTVGTLILAAAIIEVVVNVLVMNDKVATSATPAASQVNAPPPSAASTPLYREWTVQDGGGWVLTDVMCTPVRGTFIADPAPRALPAAPRAELVKYPGSEGI